MHSVNHSFIHESYSDMYDAIDGIPGQLMSLPRNYQSTSSTSSSSSSCSLDLMSLAQPIWDIQYNKDEIFVDAFSFRPADDPRECRAGFLNLLRQLKIPPVFHFQLNGKTYEPDDTYDDEPNRPMLFDLIPLLECRRNLVRDGDNVRGFEVLINWIIQRYAPDEEISFAVFDPPHKEIEREVIGLSRLMEIYGFRPEMAARFEAYSDFPSQSTVYVPMERRELNTNFCLPDAFQMGQFREEIKNIERCLGEIIGFWMDTQDPRLLDELASYVMIAENDLLPRCPPYLESALRHQVIFAKDILFQLQDVSEQAEPALKLSPESDRRQRRLEKE